MSSYTKESIIVELLPQIDEILKTDSDTLITNYKSKNSPLPLLIRDAKPEISLFKELLSYIKRDGLNLLPYFRLRSLRDALHQIFFHINQINEYTVKPQEAMDQQERAMSQFFRDGSGNIMSQINIAWPIVMEAVALELRSTSHVIDAITSSGEIQELLAQAKETKGQIDGVLKTTQEEIANKGVEKHAEIFRTLSQSHESSARRWRWVSIGIIGSNILAIAGLFCGMLYIKDHSRIVLGASGILLVSLISYALVLTVRSYFAEKHNAAINRHKANCLSTFQTFADGAPAEIKAVILQYTTQTIFSTYNPGYLSKEPIQSPSPIIEILRTINPKSL
jgi:orotate phosphoribosyltransferase-like protein